MSSTELISRSPEETLEMGRELARRINSPMLVLLTGDLGSGKTTFTKGLISGLGAAAEEEVTSPTFTLIHEYRGPKATLYHIDLYRVETQRDLDTLGLDDLMGDQSILLIEWGEKFPRFLRERDVEIVLEWAGEERRKLVVRS